VAAPAVSRPVRQQLLAERQAERLRLAVDRLSAAVANVCALSALA
jgi:hypothetical protein